MVTPDIKRCELEGCEVMHHRRSPYCSQAHLQEANRLRVRREKRRLAGEDDDAPHLPLSQRADVEPRWGGSGAPVSQQDAATIARRALLDAADAWDKQSPAQLVGLADRARRERLSMPVAFLRWRAYHPS